MSIFPTQEFDTPRPRLSLDGEWMFTYDPEDAGVHEEWFQPAHVFPERITIPGCSQAHRYASARMVESDYDGLPELAAQVCLRYPSVDVSWYARSFTVPAEWAGQACWLHIGGVNPAADLWLNGHHLGRTTSSRCPVRVEVTPYLQDGENRLTLRIDWPDDGFHGLYNMLVAWSGLYRSAWLETTAPSHLADIHVLPSITPRGAAVTVAIRHTGEERPATVDCIATDGERTYTASSQCRLSAPETEVLLELPMPEAALWSPDDPRLHTLTVRLRDGKTRLDEGRVRFGLREVRVDSFHVLLNGTPIFLRGGCDDMHYPHTICPPADTDFYRQRLRQARDYGFNYTKSCVEIYTREYLEAADEVGMLVCQEMPFLMRDELVRFPDGLPEQRIAFFRRELANIIRADRNHPAVIIYSMSSELGTAWLTNPYHFHLFSQELPALARTLHPAALIIDATGVSGPDVLLPEQQAIPLDTAHGRRNTDLDGSSMRWQGFFIPLAGPMTGMETVTTPFIFHEYAWITALSEPALIDRYAALPMLPLHVPAMVDAAQVHGQAEILPAMITASRKLKYALRKHAFEMARMEPKAAGYHHWLLHDFPFCAEGVFNEFWEAPADLPAEAFRAANDDTVLCLRHGDRWSLAWGALWTLACTISHFGAKTLEAPTITWRLCEGERELAKGRIPLDAVAPGMLVTAPPLPVPMLESDRPTALILEATLRDGERYVTRNSWRLWAFPPVAMPDGVHVAIDGLAEQFGITSVSDASLLLTDRLDAEALALLARGGRVVLLNPGVPEQIEGDLLTYTPLPNTPIPGDFPRAPGDPLYRTICYNMGTEGNMGTLVRSHPALGDFPHDGWCDFAWAPLLEWSRPFDLTAFPHHIDPIIRSIGHMRTLRDKAYLFELGVGKGRLLAAALHLPPTDPAARYLLAALLRYLLSDKLETATCIDVEALPVLRG